MDDEIRVTVIATGIDGKKSGVPAAPKPVSFVKPEATKHTAFGAKKETKSPVGGFAVPSTEIPPWIRSK